MCGIAYGKPSEVLDIFEKQIGRGLDAVGLVWLGAKPFSYRIAPNEGDAIPTQAVYLKMLKEYFEQWEIETPVIFHHRKSSIGKGGTDNAHPHIGKKFFLMQNGTSKDMRTWGDIELIDGNKSDTYCLLQYLERHCKNLTQIGELLSVVPWVVGTLLVADMHGQVLFFSDKMRESYITINDNMVTGISSLNPDHVSGEYYNKGYLLFNFDGTIVTNKLNDDINELKVKPVHKSHCGYDTQYTYPLYTTAVDRVFTSIDDLNLLLIETGGVMSKKMSKLFPSAYDSFMEDVDRFTYDVYTKTKNVLSTYMGEKEYRSRQWQSKYRLVIMALKHAGISPGSAAHSVFANYGGYLNFRKIAKDILDELRKGRIKTSMNPNINPTQQEIPILPSPTISSPEPINDNDDGEELTMAETIKYLQGNDDIPPYEAYAEQMGLNIGDMVTFDDGTLGEVYDDITVLYQHEPYIVNEQTDGRKYITVKESSSDWLLGIKKDVMCVMKKYITNITPLGN